MVIPLYISSTVY